MTIMILNGSKSFSEQVPPAQKEDRFHLVYIATQLSSLLVYLLLNVQPSQILIRLPSPWPCNIQVKIFLYFYHLCPITNFLFFKFNWLSMFLFFLSQSIVVFPIHTQYIPHIKSCVDSGCCPHLLSFSSVVS